MMKIITIWMIKEVVTVTPNQTVSEACALMKKSNIGSVIVVEDKKPVGIFTERDLLFKVAAEGRDYVQMQIGKVMTPNVLTADTSTDAEQVYNLMRLHKIRHLPIVENEALVGIVSIRDLLRFHMQTMDQTIIDLSNELSFIKGILNQTGEERVKTLFLETKKLESLVMVDSLTGLYNYRYFEDAFAAEICRAQRYGHPLSLLFIDIDYFKHYNDTNGHEQGNVLLKQLANLLKSTSRTTDKLCKVKGIDIVARYGGEEFVIVLPETNKIGGHARANRVLEDVRNYPFPYGEKQPGGKLTVSIGIAEFPSDATTWEEVIQRADEALYRAKNSGKDRCE
jgi:diguanylate cyclase (GGDEF)-like protein